MIRRSRISVRPNVKPTGRVLSTSREPSQSSSQTDQACADNSRDAEVNTKGDEISPVSSAPSAEPKKDTEFLSDSTVTQPETNNPAG